MMETTAGKMAALQLRLTDGAPGGRALPTTGACVWRVGRVEIAGVYGIRCQSGGLQQCFHKRTLNGSWNSCV